MSTHDAVPDVAERAAGVLGPESGLLQDLDAAGFGDALRRAITATATNPADSLRAVACQLATDLARIPVVAGAKAFGADLEPPVAVDPEGPALRRPGLGGEPAVLRHPADATSRRAGWRVTWSAPRRWPRTRRARPGCSWTSMLDALAPTNFLPTNPAALKRAFDTGGGSLVEGARQFLDDLRNNGGRPRQVDTSGFEVGREPRRHARRRWCTATT